MFSLFTGGRQKFHAHRTADIATDRKYSSVSFVDFHDDIAVRSRAFPHLTSSFCEIAINRST
jgi:hypothetical protein